MMGRRQCFSFEEDILLSEGTRNFKISWDDIQDVASIIYLSKLPSKN